MRASPLPVTAAVIALSVAAVTGCNSQDRAGGTAGDHPVVLSFAEPNTEPDAALTLWAQKVSEESKGSVKIAFRNGYREGEPEYEKGVVRDVVAGTIDAGWVGARVFDKVGVTSFVPLLAPMLIDSQKMQAKVFEAGIPDKMLTGLDSIKVHGIGVLPGPIRRVLSKGQPLITPAAFRGLTVGSASSGVADDTYAALGASMRPMPTGADITDLDAMEAQMGAVAGNHYEDKGGKSVVGNVNLWPRPLVLLANQDVWGELAPAQRAVLTHAVDEVLPTALQAAQQDDMSGTQAECGYGLAMPLATPEQLTAFRDAFQPVYAAIARDKANATRLTQIEAIKARASTGPDRAACTSDAAGRPGGGKALPDGTYISHREGQIGCLDFKATTFKMILAKGVARTYVKDPTTTGFELGSKGTYRIFKNRLEITDSETVSTMDFTFDGKTLTLSNVQGGGCDGEAVLSGGPWKLQ